MCDDPTGHTYTFEPTMATAVWAHHTASGSGLTARCEAARQQGLFKEALYLDRLWWYLYGWGSIGRDEEDEVSEADFAATIKGYINQQEIVAADEDPK